MWLHNTIRQAGTTNYVYQHKVALSHPAAEKHFTNELGHQKKNTHQSN